MPRSGTLIVTYDVADDRRRRHLARLLESYGTRVQQSVFECPLRPAERTALMKRLRAFCTPVAEKPLSVRCYWVGTEALSRTTVFGGGTPTTDASFFVV